MMKADKVQEYLDRVDRCADPDRPLVFEAWTNRTGKALRAYLKEEDWLGKAFGAHLGRVCLMTESQLVGGKAAYTLSKYRDVEELREVTKRLKNKGIAVTLVSWVDTSEKEIERWFGSGSSPAFPDIALDLGVDEVELDVEGANYPGHSAMALFRERWTEHQKRTGSSLRLVADTHSARLTRGFVDGLSPDLVAVQSYSYFSTRKKDRYWGEKYGPGNMQRHSYSRYLKATDHLGERPELIMGLASYNQHYPEEAGDGSERTVTESMLESIVASLELGVRRIRFWKLKNLMHELPIAVLRMVYDADRGLCAL